MYFNKYADKTDGAIRGFDVKSTRVKIICLFFVAVCILFAIIAMFPAIWVFLSGFKDLKEKQHCSLNRLIFQDLRKHGIN